MSSIKDINGVAFEYFQLDLVAGETSEIFQLQITPSTNDTLQSSDEEFVILQARESESGDDFIDIAVGINMNTYIPEEPVLFDFRFVALYEIEGQVTTPMFLGLINSEASEWKA